MSQEQGYIIEFHQIGNVVKVSAMDPRTLIEVSMVGAPNAGDAELTRLVVRKLEYMIAKRTRELSGGDQGGGSGGAG
jgi:phage head maturation protease